MARKRDFGADLVPKKIFNLLFVASYRYSISNNEGFLT